MKLQIEQNTISFKKGLILPFSVRLTDIILLAKRLNWFSLNIFFFLDSSSGGILTAAPFSPGPDLLRTPPTAENRLFFYK